MRVQRIFSVFVILAFVSLLSMLMNVSVVVPSYAATGTLSTLGQTVVSDGTSPFDGSPGDGLDTGAANGIIRTHDTFELSWNYVVATAGDVTFTETLVHARWDSSSAGSCSQGAGAISADRKSITCTLTNLSVGSGSYPLRAIADGAAPNGTSISGVVSSGALQSSALALTVSATPKINIGTLDLFPVVANGPGAFASATGYYFDVPVAMWADVVGVFDGTSGVRGVESLASPITFNAVPNSLHATLVSCSAGAAGGTRPVLPDAGGGNGTSVVNAARNSGVWTCAQSAAGAAVSVTVTGADTSLNSYPTKSANNSAITNNKAYIASGYVRLWVPKTATTPNTTTTFTTQITQFDPSSSSGISNYVSGYAPNQAEAASCVTGAYANCSRVVVNRVPQAVRPEVRTGNANLGLLPGSSVSWDGLGQVTSNTKFTASLLSSVPVANDSMTDITMCMKWNPAQSILDDSKVIQSSSSPSGIGVTIEYGTTVYANLAQYQAADCGRSGTGQQWFSSIAAAGGAGAITAVRITFNGALSSGASLSADIPQIAQPGLSAGEHIGFFGSLSSVETAELGSTYNPSTGTGYSGNRVTWLEARTSVAIAWDSSTSSLPAVREVTVIPTLLAGETARNTNVTVTLPSPCFVYVSGSASISPSVITPANPGPDAVLCTNDDVSSASLEFAFGDMSATPVPITFRTNISPGIQVPSNQTITASISSPSDPISSTAHSASATLAVSAVAGFSLAKTADTGRVVEGTAFNYFINWRNGSATQSGGVKIVDVLPFPGDARGSSGFQELTVNSVTLPSGASVEYSSLDSSTALALADVYPDGESPTFEWSSVKPSAVTAIRIVMANLAPSTSGTATLNVTAAGVETGGNLNNDLYGVSSFASQPIRAAVPLEIQTLGTASLAVQKSANLSEVTSAGQYLRYTIRVTNTGEEALSSLVVTDHDFTGTASAPAVTCPQMVLASGESMECVTNEYAVPQSDLDTRDSLSNSATVVGVPPAGPAVSATDSVTTPVSGRSDLTLTQIPSPNTLSQVGATVTYTLIATNSGTRTLTNLGVNTGAFNGSGTLAGITCGNTSIIPNASVTCTLTYSVTQSDLDTLSMLVHPAGAQSTDPTGSVIQSNQTQTSVPLIRQPALSLSKTAGVASFGAAGDSIPFMFTVTNIGNVTLSDVGITELAFSGTGLLGTIRCDQATLAPNAAADCTASYRATLSDYSAGQVTNTANAIATFGSTRIASAESRVNVPAVGIEPGISLATSSDIDTVSFANDVITYTFVLTNTGNVQLTGVSPQISPGGFNGHAGLSSASVQCPSATLDPLESMTCTAQYVVSQTDIDELTTLDLSSTVTAFAGSSRVSAQASEVVVEVDPVAHLDVATAASRSATTEAGDTIVFTLTLVNDGAVTLSNVTASVAANGFNGFGTLNAVTCPAMLILAPGESATCTASYTVTQRDVDELDELRLTADAAGEHGGELFETRFLPEINDTATIEVLPREDISMVKNASRGNISSAGEEIRYTFVVANIGTRTLFNVAIREGNFNGSDALGSIECAPTLEILPPGEAAMCEVRYVTTAADANQPQLINTANAEANTRLLAGARTIVSLNSTARVAVRKSHNSSADVTPASRLTLTGATGAAQMLAASLVLLLGGAAILSARKRRNR